MVMYVRRWSESGEIIAVFNFGNYISSVTLPFPEGHWLKQLDSADSQWSGKGSCVPVELASEGEVMLDLTPKSFVVFSRGSLYISRLERAE